MTSSVPSPMDLPCRRSLASKLAGGVTIGHMQLTLFSSRHLARRFRNAEREKRSARSVELDFSATEHGGGLRRGQRKVERPVSTRRPMHVVLSSKRAIGGIEATEGVAVRRAIEHGPAP